ncbi:MAG: lysine transporter LysE [Rhodoferax sp. RIFCSPLOWO2_12_FULL_60_11]|jgi:L-lysine exporter family protein LysE/ArgO|nr:MAG: lysine transporter LysE [Rhodoferax sp. RIFCSPLOWO2_12_FULL_60_11]
MLPLSHALAQAPAFNAGLLLSLSLIMALGPQNAHVLRMGLRGQHLWLTIGLCILSDVLFIGMSIFGLGQLGGLSDTIRNALVGGGILFLLVYGAQAFARFRSGAAAAMSQANASDEAVMTRRQAILAALAFSWLNPHVWLDTAVLLGTASLAWGQPGNAVFGMGAATGSVIWFTGLGVCLLCLGPRLRRPGVWRALDALVALLMWGTALVLGLGLLGL